jgi:hypothetical protein
MSDALYELSPGAAAEIIDELFAVRAVIGGDTQLHQLVSIESDVELGEHGVTGAGRTDVDHRIQMVGAGTQLTFFLT